MRLFDTHCHLDDEHFEETRSAVVERAEAEGVTCMVAVGTTADSSVRCTQLAAEYPAVVAAVGIQPNYAAEALPGDWQRIVQLVNDPHVVALGETGLDRYWDHCPFATQQDYFDRHLRLSDETQLPFIVHMRDCEADIVEMLREARQRSSLKGVMHSFTGSWETAENCLELGLHISFAGMVTYKKSEDLRQIAARIPDDRLLIETDAPYLSPHPKRGQRPNEPGLVRYTAECLAEVRGVSVETLAELTACNAESLFARQRKR
jgi:TatD DNase family protein